MVRVPLKMCLLPWMACMLALQEQKPAIAMDGMYAGFARAKPNREKITILRGTFKTDRSNYLLLVLLPTLVFFSGPVQADVTISIDRNPVHINESFQLIFETDEAVDAEPDFSPLEQNFQILNRSQSSNISIINGKYQRILKWTLQVMPTQEGDFILPAIDFGNQNSKSFLVTVKPASQTSVADNEGLILELSSDESSLYVQSQVIVTLRLLIGSSNVTGYQMGDLAIEDMDVVIESLGDVKQYQTRLDKKSYLVLEQQFALFPQQSGTLKIGPVRAEVQFGSRSRSIFDLLKSPSKLKIVRSKSLALQVLATPDTFNASHWLPSTDVQLDDEWQGDLNQLTAGEPVTRIITLTAEGLTAAQLPDLVQADVAGIKQYPDKPVFENQRSSRGIDAVLQRRIALIPTAAGRYNLPEITIPWWNISTGQQEMARIPSRTIEVRQGANSTVASTPSSDLPLVAESPGDVPPLQSEPDWLWLWVSIILGAGWLASFIAWWFSRSGSRLGSTRTDDAVKNDLPRAIKRLRRACTDNSANNARDAVLSWANALVKNRQLVNLNQVARHFGNPLKQQLDSLNRSIYSESAGDWQGESLWQTCEDIVDQHISDNKLAVLNGLQPLNPLPTGSQQN